MNGWERMQAEDVSFDELMERIAVLAKLDLDEEEKKIAQKDMEAMLGYVDKWKELDTTGIEPMSHLFDRGNVFREDIVEDRDGSEGTLKNAPQESSGGFCVPKTIQ